MGTVDKLYCTKYELYIYADLWDCYALNENVFSGIWGKLQYRRSILAAIGQKTFLMMLH